MTRKRGRPSNKEGPVVTRQELLDVAAKLIGRDGFDGASLRSIAAAANVSLSTLQYHFKTKDALGEGLIDELIVPALERPRERQTTDNESILASAIARRLETAVTRPGLSGRLLTDSSPDGIARLKYLAEATRSIRANDRNLLVALKENQIIRDVDIDGVITVIGIAISTLSSAKGAVRELVGIDLDEEAERNRLVDAITDLLLNGLRPR